MVFTLTPNILAASFLLFLSVTAFAPAAVAEEPAVGVAIDEALIRAERERFNQAIKMKDIETIKSFFAPEYHIVTGRSAQFHGGDSQARQWTQLFTDDPTFVCNRMTREIRINATWGLAEELGNWRCDYTADAEKIFSTGVYAAKWQRSNCGQWLLQSEVFTTLQCEGGEKGCRPPDSIE